MGSPCPEQAALSAHPVSRVQSPRLTAYLVLSSPATHGVTAARCWEGPALPASIERLQWPQLRAVSAMWGFLKLPFITCNMRIILPLALL